MGGGNYIRNREIDDHAPSLKEQIKEYYDERQPMEPLAKDSRTRLEPDKTFTKRAYQGYQNLLSMPIALPERLKRLLIPQSIQGHAQQGHCEFRGLRYPNATIEDVVETLPDNSWKSFWVKRQSYIDDIWIWLDRALRDPSDPRVRKPINREGQFLAGCDLVTEFGGPEDVTNAIAGFCYGARMDSAKWRERVAQKYGLDMGWGSCVAIDMCHLNEHGLTLEKLAKFAHDDAAMQRLIEAGVVLDVPQAIPSRDVRSGYVRQRVGKGVSDDAALITAGLLYGRAGYVGAMWADFIDTIDKSTDRITRGGQDEMLGKYARAEAERNGIDLRLDDDKIIDMIYLAAIDPSAPRQWIHCSQRYFYQENIYEQKTLGAARTHPAKLHFELFQELAACTSFEEMREAAQKLPTMLMSTHKSDSAAFYNAYINRLEKAQEQGIIKIY